MLVIGLATIAYGASIVPRLIISEEDGSPRAQPAELKFTNGDLTDNGDGTFSVDTSGSGGSGGGAAVFAVSEDLLHISSPTAQIDFYGGDFNLGLLTGDTVQIFLNPATTNYIHNSGTEQAATLHVTSLTVTGPLNTSGSITTNSSINAIQALITRTAAGSIAVFDQDSSNAGQIVIQNDDGALTIQTISSAGDAFLTGEAAGDVVLTWDSGQDLFLRSGNTSAQSLQLLTTGLIIQPKTSFAVATETTGQATFASSVTIRGADGLEVRFGVIAGTMTLTHVAHSRPPSLVQPLL